MFAYFVLVSHKVEMLKWNKKLYTDMHSCLQVESLRSVVDGLESSLGITRVELEGAISRMKRGEVETRRVEEALQKLQNELLKDLSEGINEVKEARERDFSSLEKTVEERLAEVSQSIKASVAEFTEAQGEAQRELSDLKSRLGDIEDPALIKQELSAIVSTVAEIKTAKQATDASADALREQIGTVREELQTRNQEVASLSQEIQSVSRVVQDNVGSLKQLVSAAESGVQALTEKTVTLESGLEQAVDAVRHVEKKVSEAAALAQTRSDDLEVRVKASEEKGDSLSASVSEITSKVESILAKYDTHESTLAAQGQLVEKAKTSLMEELDGLKSSVEESKSLGQQVGELEVRLAALEASSSSIKPEQLESLRGVVSGLEGKAAKLEGHEKAISALQKALKETTQSLASLSKAPGKKGK